MSTEILTASFPRIAGDPITYRTLNVVRVSRKPLVTAVLYLVVLLPLLVIDNDGPPHPRAYLLEFRFGSGRRLIVDAILNTVAFVPLGWLLYRATRGLPTSTAGRLAIVAAFCGMFSLSVETLQFVLPSRYSSLIDVLTNTGGAVLGAALAAGWRGGRA
jgi:hypothetical protein